MKDPEIVEQATDATSMTLRAVDDRGQVYGFKVMVSGAIEYFGDYKPSPATHRLHESVAPAIAQVLRGAGMKKVYPKTPTLMVSIGGKTYAQEVPK